MDDLDSFQDNNWDLADFDCFVNDVSPSPDLFWDHQSISLRSSEVDTSHYGATSQGKECLESECQRKRGRSDSCNKLGSKACREKLRREKLNDRFAELCSVLEPERPVKTDKMAILGDAIRVLNQLKTESQEYAEMNEKLLEEIKTLKAEKNELREEKLTLKADKEKLEQQLQAMTVPSAGFMPPHPAAYQPGPNKIAVYPSYGYLPMWHYLPPSARDTSQDHELRPPAA
nr:transcription factor bHLH104-like [Ipomoea trifida]